MFTKLTLDNFKSFGHIELDLMGKNKQPKNLAFIYGENGSGKSNLAEAFGFLTWQPIEIDDDMFEESSRYGIKSALKNIPFTKAMEEINAIVTKTSLASMARRCRTHGADGCLKLRYDFIIANKRGYYALEFDNENTLINETLVYVKKERKSVLFSITPKKVYINFVTKGVYKREIEDLIKKYWGKRTLLSIMRQESAEKNFSFLKENLIETFIDIMRFVMGVLCQVNTNDDFFHSKMVSKPSVGTIDAGQKHILAVLEDALDMYFTSLYSDIKRVFYKTNINEDNMIEYELFFDKVIVGKRRNISITEESTGTQKLLELFTYFYACLIGGTTIYDEFDTGVHDILIETVINAIKDKITGQLIATTHNTLLLENVPPESVYVIQSDHDGNKYITSIDKIEKTQKNHSNRSRYLRGVFGGIPMPAYLDMAEIASGMQESLKVAK